MIDKLDDSGIVTVVVIMVLLTILAFVYKLFSRMRIYSGAVFVMFNILERFRVLYGRLNARDELPALLNKPENKGITEFLTNNMFFMVINVPLIFATVWVVYDIFKHINSLQRLVLTGKVILPEDKRMKELEDDDTIINVTRDNGK